MVHYYDKVQDSPFRPEKIRAVLRNKEFEFYTAGGVFSPKRVDPGSVLLINKSYVNADDKVLDLGCGYGAVGISIKRSFPKSDITLTDINQRAVKLAKMNAELNKVEVNIIQGDGFEKVKGKFDVILFNPPQSAGKELCLNLIEESKRFLNKGGSLQIVARHNKGGRSFEIFMQNIFGNVKDIAKGAGYRIYLSKV